jgi:nucleoside-diphosphate-sugar epimerase
VRVFVAGATGATGVVLVPLLEARGHVVVPHVRPATAQRHPMGGHPRAAVCDLPTATGEGPSEALVGALRGCDAVVSLIGTMRERFGAGDTYATSDIGTTRTLVQAARDAGVPRFVLLSSVGAGGAGPYLRAKGEAERIVRESGLRWIVVRPSALVSPESGGEGSHGRRRTPSWLVGAGAALAGLPLVGGWIDDMRAIPIEVVATGIARALEHDIQDGVILHGRDLWRSRAEAA